MISEPLRRQQDIVRLIARWGIVPYFAGEIEGFSIEEHASPECWFPEGTVEGIWEWKGPIIMEADCAYGKFYRQKACFVSMDLFPDLVNYRRSLCEPTKDERQMLEVLTAHESLLSKELKRLCGYTEQRQRRSPLEVMAEQADPGLARRLRSATSPRRQSFDAAIGRLQMGGRVVIADFEYNYDRQGRRYGWGVARYCTPEAFFGPERLAVDRTPEASAERLLTHLRKLLPHASEKQLLRIVEG